MLALGHGGEEGEGRDDTSRLGMDVDVDAVAINALRGVRVANAELGEEVRFYFQFASLSTFALHSWSTYMH